MSENNVTARSIPELHKMKFDHSKYGFFLQDVFDGDDEAEPHSSLILKMNNMEKIEEDTYLLCGYGPIEGTEELLKEIKKSCDKVIREIKRINKKYSSRELKKT